MNNFEIWEKQLYKLRETYKAIASEELAFKIEKPATEEEVVILEEKIKNKIPKSLRDLFLNGSKEINVCENLSDEIDKKLPHELREIFSAYFNISLEEFLRAEEDRIGWIEQCFTDVNNEYDKVWYSKLGFMTVGNGDVIAFDLEDEKEDKRVVYLSHDDGDGHGVILGETFAEYFSNLLLIGGCGNEDWQMLPFIKEEGGLDPNCKNADTYREIIGLKW